MTTAATAAAAGGGLVPARPLAAHAHALRAAATLIEQAGITGLSLTINTALITIQVPSSLASPAARTAAVARLAAATGARIARHTAPGPARGWIFADGQLAGHPVRIFTALEQTP